MASGSRADAARRARSRVDVRAVRRRLQPRGTDAAAAALLGRHSGADRASGRDADRVPAAPAHGVLVRWLTRIEVWEPPRRFVDRQVRGPYELWHHTHEFEPDGDRNADPRPGSLPDRLRSARRAGAPGIRRPRSRADLDYRRDAFGPPNHPPRAGTVAFSPIIGLTTGPPFENVSARSPRRRSRP